MQLFGAIGKSKKMPKTDLAYERGMEVINKNIKTLGDRSTLLLGYLVIVILALASFIFNDSSNLLKPYALGLFVNYLAMAFTILIGVIMPSFEQVSTGNKAEIEKNMKRYKGLKFRFNFIIFYIFISSAVVSTWLSVSLFA